MIQFIKAYLSDEHGAVTVDWVVLTAAVVGIAIAAYVSIQSGSSGMSTATSTYLSTTPLADLRP